MLQLETSPGLAATGPSERIKRLKRAFNQAQPSLCIERAALYTRAHREAGGASAPVRSALGFLATCSELPVAIYEDELIVGNPGAARRAGSATASRAQLRATMFAL